MRTAAKVFSGVCVVAVVVPTSAMVWQAQPVDDRAVGAGDAVVAVEGRPYWDFPWTQRFSAGVGFGGKVVLTAGGCVGLEQSYRGTTHIAVAVWPSRTRVQGDGADLEIQVGSQHIRIGDDVEGGSETRDSFPALQGSLPAQCQALPLVDFQPGG